jgi:hypothetical protein
MPSDVDAEAMTWTYVLYKLKKSTFSNSSIHVVPGEDKILSVICMAVESIFVGSGSQVQDSPLIISFRMTAIVEPEMLWVEHMDG